MIYLGFSVSGFNVVEYIWGWVLGLGPEGLGL